LQNKYLSWRSPPPTLRGTRTPATDWRSERYRVYFGRYSTFHFISALTSACLCCWQRCILREVVSTISSACTRYKNRNTTRIKSGPI